MAIPSGIALESSHCSNHSHTSCNKSTGRYFPYTSSSSVCSASSHSQDTESSTSARSPKSRRAQRRRTRAKSKRGPIEQSLGIDYNTITAQSVGRPMFSSSINMNNTADTNGRRQTPSPMSMSMSSTSSASSSSVTSMTLRASNASSVRSLSPSFVLQQHLHSIGCLDRDDSPLRRECLQALENLLAQWTSGFFPAPYSASATVSNSADSSTTKVAAEEPLESSPSPNPSIALVTFGSYRLGVHRPTSDLDVLAVAPPAITRADFFTSLVTLMRQEEKNPVCLSKFNVRISEVHPIPSAYTPVIKFRLNGIHVDLLFARLADSKKLLDFMQRQLATSPAASLTSRPEFPIDDSDLLNQDEAGLRSLNGARVCQILLESVPNLFNYRTVLCAVKQWAVVNGIYSNVLGFFGGINLAILVAWICIKYPKANAVSLLKSFFHTFAYWEWPMPVLLCPIQETPPSSVPGAPYIPAWNPANNPRDGLHIMPIITPAYPSMNSSYNVGISQLRCMQFELFRACNLLHSMSAPENPNDYNMAFSSLFAPTDFFTRHRHFLQVVITTTVKRSTNEGDFITGTQDHIEWLRLVESRLRLLINSLETPEVQPWPLCQFFDRTVISEDSEDSASANTNDRKNAKVVATVSGFSSENCDMTGAQQNIMSSGIGDDNDGVSTRKTIVYESHFFMALRFLPGSDIIDLRPLTSDFCHKVNSWDGRKACMNLDVMHILSDDLPAFVFDREDMINKNNPDCRSETEEGDGKENTNVVGDKPSDDYLRKGNADQGRTFAAVASGAVQPVPVAASASDAETKSCNSSNIPPSGPPSTSNETEKINTPYLSAVMSSTSSSTNSKPANVSKLSSPTKRCRVTTSGDQHQQL